MSTCNETAAAMTMPGKGILAADESISTMSTRLEQVGVVPTAESRRDYRELLVTTADLAAGVSGVILCEETLGQVFSDGRPFPEAIRTLGILPGIKVDTGAKPCPGLPGETITEGLDGLPARLAGYAEAGAVFAKWRAVFTITEERPSWGAIAANSSALARYAAACQEADLVPIVEPEVLMSGEHSLERCAEVTASVHAAVRQQLRAMNVGLAGIVLKPNMVIEGEDHPVRATPEQVAEATVAVLRAWPAELAGVAFLSGGQEPERATANLAAMQSHNTPWPLTFSFGRALVSPALAAWHGDEGLVEAGQRALASHVAANANALRGRERLQPA
ncbi:fructose-bisphosphate aldolase [Mycolicibacterium chitae]|uniref:fructose-bisphosphate aldolase n=1 Tax=Mycolicibacterium chitae TaxID=1792 RepID=A0A448I8X3_MYCCI|nr:class I fructose-bisphosphate aldolase [Mycolicibacterium chitae]MCV7105471.1 fructose-bisphosphate aldolase class I [Mycolicibacterium chitae]BBZ05287.1 fructose-bisphosphate aldolase [Mycolicibacterium chitae]VEG48906.1 fructose-1,6-bisphosphate aldolase [Mycolicibacterium chitae]